jgi:hypothetical protein
MLFYFYWYKRGLVFIHMHDRIISQKVEVWANEFA